MEPDPAAGFPVRPSRQPHRAGRWNLLAILALVFLFSGKPVYADDPLPLDAIRLPPGFHVELVARLPEAREMALSPDRILYVGSMASGRVSAVELDSHWRAKRLRVVTSGLELPVGVAYRDGALFVSAVSRILRFDDIDRRLDAPPAPIVVRGDLPTATHHGWRFIAFGPDGWLYVPVGAPCNICKPDPDRYAVILRMKADGSRLQVFARGIRNTVGFDWDPVDHALWFTDNGRDYLGDDLPPDELNRADKPGLHFGYPYCHGGTIADLEFGSQHSCAEFVAPALDLGAHVAPLGMRFYAGTQFPAKFRNGIFIAEHGSWNRSGKVGYRIVFVPVRGSHAMPAEPFASGWLRGESAWGRPADVLVLPDGSLLVSDDLAGAIYRISYVAPP